MSEFDELIMRLLDQQRKLLGVIREAEIRVAMFLEAIELGRCELAKIESILNAMQAGKN